jgi:flagellar biosynthesis protein FlhF
MRIKKYIAKNMREALLQIKDELGEEAIILKTRKIPKKVFSIGAQDEVEVTAAIDEDVVKQTRPEFPPLKMTDPGVYNRPRSSNIIDLEKPGAPEVKPWRPPGNDFSNKKESTLKYHSKENTEIDELKQNVSELKDIIKKIVAKENTVAEKPAIKNSSTLQSKMLKAEISGEIANSILSKVNRENPGLNEIELEAKITSTLAEYFAVAGPLKLRKNGPIKVVFVGPTGSGKTTTLAKLAAHCCINKHKKVSIITADTYRIAAIEQIRMFADIVKVGLQVVFSPDEIIDALESCSSDDVVFIDTAGRSQRNEEHMMDLQKLTEALTPDEIHLVLSATTKDSDLKDMVKRYASINVNRLLFTKLDETVRIGNIFNLVYDCKIPVSYLTFGQSVPDDIELAKSSGFIQKLWEGTQK